MVWRSSSGYLETDPNILFDLWIRVSVKARLFSLHQQVVWEYYLHLFLIYGVFPVRKIWKVKPPELQLIPIPFLDNIITYWNLPIIHPSTSEGARVHDHQHRWRGMVHPGQVASSSQGWNTETNKHTDAQTTIQTHTCFYKLMYLDFRRKPEHKSKPCRHSTNTSRFDPRTFLL